MSVPLQVGQALVYASTRPLLNIDRPISLDPVACHFPELKRVGVHAGIPWEDQFIPAASKQENVFVVADARLPRNWPETLARFVDSHGQHDRMYGTEFPVLDFFRCRAEVDAFDLHPESRRVFLRGNAIPVFGIDP